MERNLSKSRFLGIVLSLLCIPEACGSQKVKLKDVSTLTLHSGKMTTGRRASPVPQLSCVGGSAGCSNAPSVVQCYNRGTDGSDVQWECKAEMSKAQRFGSVEVLCEGYDYPDDPYILRGSCGLEYTLDATGHQDTYSTYSSHYSAKPKQKRNTFGDILFIGVAVFIMYVIYKSCISTGHRDAAATGHNTYYPDNPDDPYGPSAPRWGGGGGGFYPGGTPSPPGFRPDLGTGGGCGARPSGMGMGSAGAGGFWTGAATGGILGYLLGNRGGSGNTNAWGYPQEGTRASGTSSFFSSPSGSSSSSSGASYTSSGFGGTRRR